MARSIASVSGKSNFIRSRWALRVLTQAYTGALLDEEFVSKERHGKPRLRNFPSLHFSLSHTLDEVVVGFANQPLGLDVENPGRPVNTNGIARRFFHPDEWSVETSGRWEFFHLWTAKEAMLKLDGRGLAGGLHAARVLGPGVGCLDGRPVVLHRAEWSQALAQVATWTETAGMELRTLATPQSLLGNL